MNKLIVLENLLSTIQKCKILAWTAFSGIKDKKLIKLYLIFAPSIKTNNLIKCNEIV